MSSHRDLTDIVNEAKETHPEDCFPITHSCGHTVNWYVPGSMAHKVAVQQAEEQQPCSRCSPCEWCGKQQCECPDPFADNESGG